MKLVRYIPTDSLIPLIKTDNFMRIRKKLEKFDTSNFDENNIHDMVVNL